MAKQAHSNHHKQANSNHHTWPQCVILGLSRDALYWKMKIKSISGLPARVDKFRQRLRSVTGEISQRFITHSAVYAARWLHSFTEYFSECRTAGAGQTLGQVNLLNGLLIYCSSTSVFFITSMSTSTCQQVAKATRKQCLFVVVCCRISVFFGCSRLRLNTIEMPKKSLRCVVEIKINSVSYVFVCTDATTAQRLCKQPVEPTLMYYGTTAIPKRKTKLF